MAAVTQADWAGNGTVEVEPDRKAYVVRRLRTVSPTAHEVPESACIVSPIENFYLNRREAAAAELGFNLAYEG